MNHHLNPEDRSLDPKRYNGDFFFSLDDFVFKIFLYIVSFISIIYCQIYVYKGQLKRF